MSNLRKIFYKGLPILYGQPCFPFLNHYCGYVGVPSENKYNGVDAFDEAFYDAPAHKGVTFSGQMDDSNYWFIGFDYGHFGDDKLGINNSKVIEQCQKLADWLLEKG